MNSIIFFFFFVFNSGLRLLCLFCLHILFSSTSFKLSNILFPLGWYYFIKAGILSCFVLDRCTVQFCLYSSILSFKLYMSTLWMSSFLIRSLLVHPFTTWIQYISFQERVFYTYLVLFYPWFTSTHQHRDSHCFVELQFCVLFIMKL